MSKSDVFNQSLLEFKQNLAMKLVFGLAIFCSVGLPLSLSRWAQIGFQYVFIHHIIITLSIYACCLWSNKIRFKLNLTVIILLLSSMIITGTLSFGLQAGAATFAVFCTFLIALGWGFIAALVYAAGWCVYVISIGYLFSNNYIANVISPNEYAATLGAWVIVALGSSLIIILMLITAKQAFYFFSCLVEEIEEQKGKIANLANTDSLTDFFNGRLAMPLLSQALSVAQREHSKVGVVFIDLNNFKQINDQHGHHVGDLVLQKSARRIRAVLRDMDIACRIGGDEFLFIIPKVNTVQEIEAVLQRIVETWSEPIAFEGKKITVTGSIGVAVYPENGSSAQVLREKADRAMYLAKNNNVAIKFFA